jgi:histidinol dehydrogenase
MEIINWNTLSATDQANSLRRSPLVDDDTLEQDVALILTAVRDGGDVALRDLSEKFDGVTLDTLRLDDTQIAGACERVSPELKQAIAQAMANIGTFHRAQSANNLTLETQPGVHCELRTEAIERVGLYIPGGSAPLISTVLMLALPARLAGCELRVLVSPPPIDDAIVYAANACGITDIFQLGGAQAIAALAYGSESVPGVDKIFGPGNRYVTEAKRQLTRDSRCRVSIDMPAGPSEVLVIADNNANCDFIAADLLSQAEHGPDSQVILVTDSIDIARGVNLALESQLATLSRADIARQALANGRIILVGDLQQAAKVSNSYGPEHLIIQSQFPREVLKNIRGAGSVFLGAYTPESVGDYASGTNHVLPTYGYSRSVSSLSLADFCRRFTVQELSRDGLRALAPTVMTLAVNEGLDGHSNAVALRLTSLTTASETGEANYE